VTRGAALTLLVATCSALGAGCGKDKQSLVLVNLRLAGADDRAMNLKSVTLTANPGPTKEFPLSMLSADMNTEFGLYLAGSVSGDVSILAIAEPNQGCVGFRGSGAVVIESPGETKPVLVLMQAANTCIDDGGVGGSGGAAGTAGTAGSTGGGGAAGTGTGGGGTTGAAGTGTGGGGRGGGMGGMAGYPSIASCRTFNHATNTTCPSVYVNKVAIAPNGQLVASGGDDGRVKIWNFDGRMLTAAGKEFTGFTNGGLAFSPDGTRLAYTAGATVRTYTVAGWTAGTTLLDDGSGNSLSGLGFTPDGMRIVSVNAIGFAGGDVFVHNVGGSALPALTAHIDDEPYSLSVAVRANSDSSINVAVGSYYGTATMLTLTANAFAGSITVPASTTTRTTYTTEFSPDGAMFVTGEDYGAVRFFNLPLSSSPAPTGNPISFAGGDSVNDIAFSPSGLYLAVGGAFSSRQLSIYSVATHAEMDRATPPGDVRSLVFSPNGAAIIAGLDECSYVVVCN
jgi:hypothetical protein